MDNLDSDCGSQRGGDLPQPAVRPSQEVIHALAQPISTVPGGFAPERTVLVSSAIPTVDNLLKAFRQRWLLALMVGILLGVSAGVGSWYIKPPLYTAQATLEVSPNEYRLLSPEQVSASSNSESYQRTQAALVKSRRVLAKALSQEGVSTLQMVRLRPDPLTWLEEELKTNFLEGTYLLRISLSGDEAKELADIVNAVKDAYLTEVANAERTQRLRQLDDLENACKQAEKTLKGKRDLLQMLAENLAASDMKEAAHMQSLELDKLNSLYARHSKIESELGDAELILETKQPAPDGKGGDGEVPKGMVEERLDEHPFVVELKKKLVDVEERADRHRKVALNGKISAELERELRVIKTSIERTKDKLRGEVAAHIRRELAAKTLPELNQLRDKVRILRRQLADVKAKIKEQETVVQAVGKSSISLELKRGEIQDADAILKLVRERREQLQMELLSTNQRIREQDNAAVPRMKNTRNSLVRAGMLAFWFFLIGVFGVAYREYRIGRVGNREDVSERLRLPVFGTLPVLSGDSGLLGSRNVVARARSASHLLRECIDGIRTTLLRHDPTASRRVFLVTSPGSKEGKTTLSVHLASSIARAHCKTLLVDCDLRNPSIHRILDLPVTPGLSQVLKGKVPLAEAILPTPVEGLYSLSSGESLPDGVNALSHRDFEKMFGQLRQQFDYIIIDCSPVLPVVDPLLVGVHADGVLLSVRPRVSQMPRIHEALERLTAARIPILGGVLNGVARSLYPPDYHYALPPQRQESQG